MLPSLSRPPLECCFGTNPIQAEKLRPDRKLLGSPTLARAPRRATDHTWNTIKALARLIVAVPSEDHSIKFQDLLFEAEQLAAQSRNAGAHDLRHPLIARIGNDTQQFLDTSAPDRRGNAKFGKVSANRVDYRSLLADQQMTRAMKHQAALLLRRLGWHEPHIGSGDSFTNRLSVGHIVLLPLDVRLHIRRRHQACRMAKRLQLA